MAKARKYDNTTVEISKLEAEKRVLYVSKSDTKRLAEVIAKLDFIYYGIKKE
jgi:hypothetical protein